MAIKIEVTTDMVFRHLLREDTVENLGWEGIEALINYYNEQEEEDIEYDPSLFWSFHRYDNAREACEDRGIEVDREDFDGELLDDDDYEEACRKELRDNSIVLELDDGSVVVSKY